ncbi:hypothetical protein GLW08_06770 [Pontibacillus yanchengensis]|uniref:Cxxc_20_cxxc protein n=2 Tax=Pontibacillus yanchengensis TaxID=462910 RepID=A0A6I4ZQG6_9BACI|nr:hypothetical protein [Pontibacillus yanchengensis]MYL53039.1 hypothetical protein [Pontibacillus yanchengensis]
MGDFSCIKCKNCNAQFSWGGIYLSLLFAYSPIECKECSTTHKITFTSRFITVFFTALPIFIFIEFLSPFNNTAVTLFTGFIICIIGFLVLPSLVTYRESA